MNKSVVIDTNAYSAYKRGEKAAIEVIKEAQTIVFSPIVLGELLGGFALGKRSDQNQRELKEFLDQPKVLLLTLNAQTAEAYSRIYQQLRTKGRPIPSNDMWIAAMATQLEIAVFTYDTHFSAIDGLRVVQTPMDFLD